MSGSSPFTSPGRVSPRPVAAGCLGCRSGVSARLALGQAAFGIHRPGALAALLPSAAQVRLVVLWLFHPSEAGEWAPSCYALKGRFGPTSVA